MTKADCDCLEGFLIEVDIVSAFVLLIRPIRTRRTAEISFKLDL